MGLGIGLGSGLGLEPVEPRLLLELVRDPLRHVVRRVLHLGDTGEM